MRVRVILTRCRGVRRKPAEIRADPGVQGMLSVNFMLETHYGRPMRLAHLTQALGVSGMNVDALPPLGDPVIVRLDKDGMVLVGTESDVDLSKGMHAEHAQGWLIRLG